ncbi:NAD(P)-dependent oxidoreductase [Gordonia rubripertincta]|uniref:3-oxoacyl-[acyl-carrier-protein] reductase MabA n=1 Tax=Gordonia rubripertincta TaxID=36822 RepID=A0AAW4G8L4_GORRU|nr:MULTISPECIES: mycofactocin-coupled SDR family oxidoreductase [Gordonia]MBM7279618.1 mycofactocin-coupled SDR family oxidoreductase [Gordonia rubripertincta]QMU21877.1 mycofactocin-coupled SDR family oxidoreductase [Gordonia rubripertincta]TSD95818.1 NAD(P)-dependent oxidoreductase [Gordonia rubripertincta]
MGTFDGQIAFITGGARGQGRSHAVHLASLGADIVIVDSIKDNVTTPYGMATQADLDETVRLVEAQGRKAYARAIDVRDLDGLIAFADEVVERYGKIDILLANAGIMTAVPIAEMSGEVWAETVDINLTGVFNSFRAVLPHMVKAGYGRVVATSSGGGHIGFNNLAHYCAAKWGVIGLVKSAALEVAQSGVTVNAVTPTNVNTDMIRNDACEALFLPGIENPTQEQIEEAYVINPMGVPWIEPIDVSRTIAFLVSPESKFITGETIGPLAGSGATNGAA